MRSFKHKNREVQYLINEIDQIQTSKIKTKKQRTTTLNILYIIPSNMMLSLHLKAKPKWQPKIRKEIDHVKIKDG